MATIWPPAVNQVEAHPLYPQDELLAYCTQDDESMAKLCLLGDLTYRFYGVAGTIPARLVDVRCELRSAEERGDGEPFVLVA